MTPTARLAAVLALAALAAAVAGTGVAVLLALGALAAAAVDARAARRPPAAERVLPAVLARGVPAGLRVTAVPSPGCRVRIRQALPSGLAATPDVAEGELEATLVGARRGRHIAPPAAVRVTGPLGLVSADHAVGGAQEVLVYPDVPAARRLAIAARRGRLRDAGRLVRGPLGLGTEFESVRDYLPDDDIRQVNWQATARMRRPMSNQYRIEQDREVVCLVDCGRLMAAPLGDRSRLDAAVDAATAVGHVADALGDRCGVLAFDAEIRRALRPRRQGGAAIARALFDVQAAGVEADHELAFRRVEGGKRALVLLLCDLVDEAAARSLVDAMPVLVRRHAVVVATARDPGLHALLDRRPSSTADVYAAAVALDVLGSRDRAAARIRAAGADVVEAPPEQLARACVAAYVTAKARARL
jgi:uncharacterized protein (DUF58 family)